MLIRALKEWKEYGIITIIQHIRLMLTKSREASYAYYSSKIKNKSQKELEIELEKEFKNCNFYEMDFSNPQTYCQKVYWLRLYGGTPLKQKLADKYLCREYVRDTIGEEYNVPLLGVWDDFEEIDFNKLPKQFVLKTNHGCGFNLIIKNKDDMNKSYVKKTINKWMKMNYALFYCEMQYYNIPRKILAEQYLEQIDGGLYDYKFHCINGKPLFCEVIGERNEATGEARQAIYDCKWNLLEFTFGDFEQFDYVISKPKLLEEMVEISTKLSLGIDYVRVDLYMIEDKVFVGELTFTSAGGNNPNITPKHADLELGRMIHLAEPYYLDIKKE